jgi:hypothetical protein
MLTRIAAASGLALTLAAGSLALIAPPAAADIAGSVGIRQACINGAVSGAHVLVDESFTGLGPGVSYFVTLSRPDADNEQSGANETSWVADGTGAHVGTSDMEVFGNEPVAQVGQTYHWYLKTGPSHTVIYDGSAVVQVGTCASPGNPVPAVPDTTVTASKIKAAKHKATFTFTGTSATGFQCRLKKAHHAASYASCSSPRTYKHLSGGKYKFFVRAVGPGGTDGSPAKVPFKI